jgi:multidrug resistance efflux pump
MGNSTTSLKAALTLSPAIPQRGLLAHKLPIPNGRLKIAIGLGVLLAGTYGILSEHNFISTNDAVVSAYVVVVRTPIDGIVQGLLPASNLHVRQGQSLGHVEDSPFDQQRLENLRTVEARARSEAEALLIEKSTLEQQEVELLARANAHAKAVSKRIQLNLQGDERLLFARQAAAKQAEHNLQRGHLLRQSGIISDAEVDRLQTQYEIASKESQAQQAVVSAAHSEANSAAKGIFIEPGYSEIDYSRQRYDDIRLRLADINRSIAALQIQAQAARDDLSKESHAELTSPTSGLLWKLDAVNGERVATGDPVAEFVDCNQAFVLVEIPQDRVPDLAVGAQARIRLSGEVEERYGTLASVAIDPRKDNNHKLAAVPLRDLSDQRAIARVDLNEFHGECLVSRTARVLISTHGTSVASRWFRQNF